MNAALRLPVITNSAARCFRRCPREYRLSYGLGYRSVVEADALRFGTLVHLGLEAWWRATERRFEAVLDAIKGKAADEFEYARAVVTLAGYDARWSADMEHYEVLAVECEFRAPLVNPDTGASSRTFELAGKLDVVVRDRRDGLVKLIEHKTSAADISAGSTYWRRLVLDSQVSTYFAGGRASGFDIAECIYDVLGKPAIRPGMVPVLDDLGVKIVLDADGERVRTKDQKKWRQTGDTALGYVLKTRPETAEEFRVRLTEHVAENPHRYYQRGSVVRLESEEHDAAFDMWSVARSIRESELANRHPRNVDSCERYGSLCVFFEVCCGNASLDDESRFRKVESVHEELSSQEAAA